MTALCYTYILACIDGINLGVSLNYEIKSKFHFTVNKTTTETFFSQLKRHHVSVEVNPWQPVSTKLGHRGKNLEVETLLSCCMRTKELQDRACKQVSPGPWAYTHQKYPSNWVLELPLKETKIFVILWPKLNLLKW